MQTAPASVYNDFQGLAALKHQAREDQAGSLDKVARQFESLFVQMMVKQMRQASFGGGILDSDHTRQYQDMYDQQLSLHLSESGGMGIGDMLRRQLGQSQLDQHGGDAVQPLSGLQAYWEHPVNPARRYQQIQPLEQPEAAQQSGPKMESAAPPLDSPEQFVHSLWSSAQRAAARIGLPAEALLAQAALETGWGGHIMPAANARSSHNLFGIKADQRWNGEQVRRETLEYESGVAVRRREAFRAYDSYEESLQDYVDFLQQSPRYADALNKTHDTQAYFKALQQAGYATDPRYAEKIERVLKGPEMGRALAQLKETEQLSL